MIVALDGVGAGAVDGVATRPKPHGSPVAIMFYETKNKDIFLMSRKQKEHEPKPNFYFDYDEIQNGKYSKEWDASLISRKQEKQVLKMSPQRSRSNPKKTFGYWMTATAPKTGQHLNVLTNTKPLFISQSEVNRIPHTRAHHNWTPYLHNGDQFSSREVNWFNELVTADEGNRDMRGWTIWTDFVGDRRMKTSDIILLNKVRTRQALFRSSGRRVFGMYTMTNKCPPHIVSKKAAKLLGCDLVQSTEERPEIGEDDEVQGNPATNVGVGETKSTNLRQHTYNQYAIGEDDEVQGNPTTNVGVVQTGRSNVDFDPSQHETKSTNSLQSNYFETKRKKTN